MSRFIPIICGIFANNTCKFIFLSFKIKNRVWDNAHHIVPYTKLFTANRARFSFPYPLFLRPKSKAAVFLSIFQEAIFYLNPALPLSVSQCYCACRRSCYNFVSQKSPLHTSTRRSPSISSNLLRYRTALLSTSIQVTFVGRFGTSEYGLSKRAGTFLQPLSLCIFLQFSPILLDKSIKAYKNRATGVNVVSVGSPSRILIVRRISFGMTTLPSSSMRRTIPVAFIYNSPVNVIFGIRRIMRRNALKKVFREYYLHNALIYSRFCNKNHSKAPFHKRCRKDT